MTVTGWLDNTIDKLGTPRALRLGFFFWVTAGIISQMFIIFWVLASRIDVSPDLGENLKRIFTFGASGLPDYGRLLIGAGVMVATQLRALVFLAAGIGVALAAVVPLLVPDNWMEPVDELVLLGETGLAAAVLLLPVLELLPFLIA